mmetsp:Transcript_40503/g.128673  ORF Transcript_40503/g.128673 Transcript_40503/m.128673 type:complete len:167 (-) Transcript_40503:55-555(-)
METGGSSGSLAGDQATARPAEVDPAVVFAYYDSDSDGRLSTEEFLGALRATGACPSPGDLQEACRASGGTLDLRAFQAASRELLRRRPTAKDIVDQFRGVAEGGLLDAEVLRYAVTRYGDALTPEELEQLMTLACPDKDGNVDIQRLAEALLPPLPPAAEKDGGPQ